MPFTAKQPVSESPIMASYFYCDESAVESADFSSYESILINYDMYWHTKAHGKTIAGNIEEAGFYAPEHVENIEGDQARTTLVDSYGVGMSIFYAYTTMVPPRGGSTSVDWLDLLKIAV